jgi:XTP/dITP diphosphohydrolase
MQRQLVLATRNRKKTEELRLLLRRLPVEILSLADFPQVEEIEEAGSTFEDNAVAKATAAAYLTKKVALADDSGLEVDALGGAPGVKSNRYAGDGASDWDKISKVLSELPDSNKSNRIARFRCAIAVCRPDGELETFEGRVGGWISLLPLGAHGFGYDPIFVVPELEKTMAEIAPEVKNTMSHRARAVRKALPYLAKTFEVELLPETEPLVSVLGPPPESDDSPAPKAVKPASEPDPEPPPDLTPTPLDEH